MVGSEMTTSPPAPSHEAAPRWRRITAAVLLGLAILAVILGPISLWVRTQLLDAGEFQHRAETVLASSDVQDYLSDALTARLVERGGAEAERAEPLVHAVVNGVVTSDRFKEAFGRAVGVLHARLISGNAGERVIELQEAVDSAVAAIAVVRPQLAERIQGARPEIRVGEGTTGRRIAQFAERAEQLRVFGIVMPIVAFALIALSILVSPQRLRATRRAGWGLIAGGAVVTLAVALTRRTLLGLVDDAVIRGAIGETESAYLAGLGRWGAWVTAIGVVMVGVSVFLGSRLTLREQALRMWESSTSRPARTRTLVVRLLFLLVVVLLAIFALDALLTTLVAVVIALLVAYGIAEILRLAGVGAPRTRPAA
jgi:NADH:ubiquinone oxidoreductase subunit 3 (subunit A)